MEQFEIISNPRHLRLIYFVESDIDYDAVCSIIKRNLTRWGGRYNPIIPVHQGHISQRYIELLGHLDPDYVICSEGVDFDIIKSLRLFQPTNYLKLSEAEPLGVPTTALISKHALASKRVVNVSLDVVDKKYTDFVLFNLEIGSTTWGDIFSARFEPDVMVLNGEEVGKWFESLCEIHYISSLQHSSNQAYIKHFRPEKFSGRRTLEIVVAATSSSLSDLLYFWNRRLYQDQQVVYVTIEQLTHFLNDPYFQNLILNWTWFDVCEFVSTSLSDAELSRTVEGRIGEIKARKTVDFKHVNDFPFKILDSSYIWEANHVRGINNQLINSHRGLYSIPKPRFNPEIGIYAVDFRIRNFDNHYLPEVQFPKTTDVRSIFSGFEGRVNLTNSLTLFTKGHWNSSTSLNITIPKFDDLVKQLIRRPMVDGHQEKSSFIDLGPSDSSNKLLAFITSFESSFIVMDDVLGDCYWMEIFRELSLGKSQVGDTITFSKLKFKALQALEKKKIELVNKKDGSRNEENLEYGLKDTLEEWCSYKVFFKGLTIKCGDCSSSYWYSLDEVGSSLRCKGCQQALRVPVEPTFSYKFNELIRNNFFDSIGNPDGNLTVLRTLIYLQKNSHQSFAYHPQINLYDSYDSNKPIGDIDIVCLSDGKFVIGEAKHNSTEFKKDSSKCLRSLVKVCREIRPDKVVLSCSVNPNSGIENAKKSLIRLFEQWSYMPEIETIVLSPPDDYHVGGHRYFRY